MPSNYPTPEQLQQETALLQRMARAGYAGIPTGGAMEPQLPAQPPLQTMAQAPGLNPAEQQEQTLRQLGIGPNAGYKSMKAPSIIPLSTVLSNGDSDYNVSAAPLAQGNKFRALNAEVSGPLAGGELALQGGAGRMFGKFKSPTEYEVGLKYTKGFADGGFVDGKSLEEPIGVNTQQQINSMMANGGLASTARQDLASFAKGGDVDVNDFQPPLQQQQPNAMEVLKAEFAKRGLDFNKFIASPPVMQQALANAQNMGIKGDTMLAHINPKEAKLLKEHGGSGDINPNTGLPMFEDGEGEGNGNGNGNGTSSNQSEQGPGIGNNGSFGNNTGQQGPGLGLNDSFGSMPGLSSDIGNLGSSLGASLGSSLSNALGDTSKAGFGFSGVEAGKAAPDMGSLSSFDLGNLGYSLGPNTNVLGTNFGTEIAGSLGFGPDFGITNFDAATNSPSVTGVTNTTGQNPSISAALSAISQNPTTSQVAAALANAVQAATQTPAATPATTSTPQSKSSVDVAETPEQVAALEAAMMSPNQAPTTSAKAATNLTDIGTPATKAAQETTLAEDISAAINNAITNALNNPMATAINTGLSLASPPLGLANMVSGILGYGTLGSGITNAFSGQQSASKSDVASNLGGGRDSSGGDGGTGGASLAGVQTGTTPTTTSSVLASLANPTTTSNNQFRQFAGYAPNPLNYGYGPAYNFYTYKSAKGGKVSPLKAMRKA